MGRRLTDSEMKAVDLSVRVIGKWAKDNRISIPALDPALKEVVAAFAPVYQRRGKDGIDVLLGYELTDIGAEKIAALYSKHRRAHEFIIDIAKANILLGYPIPEVLRPIVADQLTARIGAPPDGGTKNAFERNILFVMMAERMKEKYGITRYSERNLSAVDIIWAACTAFGVTVTKTQTAKVIRENTGLRSYCETHLSILGDESPVVRALGGSSAQPAFTLQHQAYTKALSRLEHTLNDQA